MGYQVTITNDETQVHTRSHTDSDMVTYDYDNDTARHRRITSALTFVGSFFERRTLDPAFHAHRVAILHVAAGCFKNLVPSSKSSMQVVSKATAHNANGPMLSDRSATATCTLSSFQHSR